MGFLNDMADAAGENSKSKGFLDSENIALELITEHGSFFTHEDVKNAYNSRRLALIHSEVSEALEAIREGKKADLESFAVEMEDLETAYKKHIKGSIEDEMADIIIRALDYCHHNDIDIQTFVDIKMNYNQSRPVKHGKKF